MSQESEAEILKELRELRSDTKDIFRMFSQLREVEERREQRWLTAVQENKLLHDRIEAYDSKSKRRDQDLEARITKLEGKTTKRRIA